MMPNVPAKLYQVGSCMLCGAKGRIIICCQRVRKHDWFQLARVGFDIVDILLFWCPYSYFPAISVIPFALSRTVHHAFWWHYQLPCKYSTAIPAEKCGKDKCEARPIFTNNRTSIIRWSHQVLVTCKNPAPTDTFLREPPFTKDLETFKHADNQSWPFGFKFQVSSDFRLHDF